MLRFIGTALPIVTTPESLDSALHTTIARDGAQALPQL
jgi:hypothetical protein